MITATIQFFDFFSGIGGFREGLRRAGGFTCVGHCEVDTYADKNYRLLFDTEGEWYCSDARTIEPERMPDFDLLCAGFPCQAFSIAGKREGFADARGTLFFEIARLLKAKRPQYFILENVPGLLSHDKGRTFCTILSTLSQLGYHVEWKVLNSKDFGVPQARKRVYIVGYLDFRCAGKILPEPETNGAALIQIRAGSQGKRVYSPKGLSCTLTSQAGGMGGKTGLYDVDPEYVPHVMRYYSGGSLFAGLFGNQQIVSVAMGQIGNSGGQKFWNWYGFDSHVEWCACFVSWCADQSGLIASGNVPKFSLCSDGVTWFQGKNKWQSDGTTPSAGMIIFFDWNHDGTSDHVGIVEKYEGGRVYTIEGNSSDQVRQRNYAVDYSSIMGYGLIN